MNISKEERRALMPESTKFIDDMREHFGELAGIEAEKNGHEVKWGVTWGKTESFRAMP